MADGWINKVLEKLERKLENMEQEMKRQNEEVTTKIQTVANDVAEIKKITILLLQHNGVPNPVPGSTDPEKTKPSENPLKQRASSDALPRIQGSQSDPYPNPARDLENIIPGQSHAVPYRRLRTWGNSKKNIKLEPDASKLRQLSSEDPVQDLRVGSSAVTLPVPPSPPQSSPPSADAVIVQDKGTNQVSTLHWKIPVPIFSSTPIPGPGPGPALRETLAQFPSALTLKLPKTKSSPPSQTSSSSVPKPSKKLPKIRLPPKNHKRPRVDSDDPIPKVEIIRLDSDSDGVFNNSDSEDRLDMFPASPPLQPLRTLVNSGKSGTFESIGQKSGVVPTRILDEFDRIPHPESKEHFAYKPTKIVRKKEERKNLPGWSCPSCQDYYNALGSQMEENELEKLRNKCSKHRSKHHDPEFIGNTPRYFWDPGFPSTQECLENGLIHIGESSQRNKSRHRD